MEQRASRGESTETLRAAMKDALGKAPAWTRRRRCRIERCGSGEARRGVYEFPFLSHACMEPMNITAHFTMGNARRGLRRSAGDRIAQHDREGAGAGGERRDGAYDPDGRRLRAAVSVRLSDGGGADCAARGWAGAAGVDARRRYDARLLSAGGDAADAWRAGCAGECGGLVRSFGGCVDQRPMGRPGQAQAGWRRDAAAADLSDCDGAQGIFAGRECGAAGMVAVGGELVQWDCGGELYR